MFTGITTHAGALVGAIVVLTGAAILRGGAAAADPNQDDQFLELLDKEGIPALENVPTLIAAAHGICRDLNGGMPVNDIVDMMRNDAYEVDPTARIFAPARVTRTIDRFITAAVEAYCPYDQRKIASMMANPARGPSAWQEPTGTGVVRLPHLDRDAHGIVLASLIGAVASGETTPDPPQIPAPPPPTAQILTPPRPIAAPPRPKQSPPPPQQAPPPPQQAPPPPQQPPPPPQEPPPPPQQVEPPAAPQPGGAGGNGSGGGGDGGDGTGGNGGGGNGGAGPAEPSPMPHMPPGFVRLAP